MRARLAIGVIIALIGYIILWFYYANNLIGTYQKYLDEVNGQLPERLTLNSVMEISGFPRWPKIVLNQTSILWKEETGEGAYEIAFDLPVTVEVFRGGTIALTLPEKGMVKVPRDSATYEFYVKNKRDVMIKLTERYVNKEQEVSEMESLFDVVKSFDAHVTDIAFKRGDESLFEARDFRLSLNGDWLTQEERQESELELRLEGLKLAPPRDAPPLVAGFFHVFYQETGPFDYALQATIRRVMTSEGIKPLYRTEVKVPRFSVSNKAFEFSGDAALRFGPDFVFLPEGQLRLNIHQLDNVLDYYGAFIVTQSPAAFEGKEGMLRDRLEQALVSTGSRYNEGKDLMLVFTRDKNGDTRAGHLPFSQFIENMSNAVTLQ